MTSNCYTPHEGRKFDRFHLNILHRRWIRILLPCCDLIFLRRELLEGELTETMFAFPYHKAQTTFGWKVPWPMPKKSRVSRDKPCRCFLCTSFVFWLHTFCVHFNHVWIVPQFIACVCFGWDLKLQMYRFCARRSITKKLFPCSSLHSCSQIALKWFSLPLHLQSNSKFICFVFKSGTGDLKSCF